MYKILPVSTYQEEHWLNTLTNDKIVELLVTVYFRAGTYEIELTDDEKDEFLKKTSVILNDYNCSCDELWGGSSRDIQIKDENKYTKEELNEINKLIYKYNEDDYVDEDENEEYDNSFDYIFDTDILEANCWGLNDTIYGIETNCTLEKLNEVYK